MKNNGDSQEQIPEPIGNEVDNSELSEEELDEASGGLNFTTYKTKVKISSPFEKVALNPQPLPPKVFNIGNQH